MFFLCKRNMKEMSSKWKKHWNSYIFHFFSHGLHREVKSRIEKRNIWAYPLLIAKDLFVSCLKHQIQIFYNQDQTCNEDWNYNCKLIRFYAFWRSEFDDRWRWGWRLWIVDWWRIVEKGGVQMIYLFLLLRYIWNRGSP